MRVTLAAIGRLKSGPEKDLFDHYAARLAWPLSVREAEEKKLCPPLERKEREGRLLLDTIPQHCKIVVLDERGKTFSSQAFADHLDKWRSGGDANIAFLIGGADGHGEAVRARADLLLSFGSMTWPHMLVRVLLVEQLYRAQSILSGHPYHRA